MQGRARMATWARRVAVGALVACLAGGAASAEDGSWRAAAEQNPALYAAMYGYAVCEYCSLDSAMVQDGYERETAHLIAKAGLSNEIVRKVRMRAGTDADLEYGDRGLGGFRSWCRTEGLAAAQRFLDFRAADIAAQAAEPH